MLLGAPPTGVKRGRSPLAKEARRLAVPSKGVDSDVWYTQQHNTNINPQGSTSHMHRGPRDVGALRTPKLRPSNSQTGRTATGTRQQHACHLNHTLRCCAATPAQGLHSNTPCQPLPTPDPFTTKPQSTLHKQVRLCVRYGLSYATETFMHACLMASARAPATTVHLSKDNLNLRAEEVCYQNIPRSCIAADTPSTQRLHRPCLVHTRKKVDPNFLTARQAPSSPAGLLCFPPLTLPPVQPSQFHLPPIDPQQPN